MEKRREIFEKVLALVRNELWGEPLACRVSEDEVAEVLQTAKEQSVSGLVANAIVRNRLPVGEDMTMEVCAIQKLHEKKSSDMNAEIALFAGFLNRRNLQYVIMKGQTMAALYPNPAMRTTGDIDFYCPKTSFQATQQAIEERLGVVMMHRGSKKHDNFKIEGFAFEMHTDMTDFGYFGHQKYWNRHIDPQIASTSVAVNIAGEKVRTLSPTMDALYIFVHAFYHLILNGNGMGLKQYCDWCMVMDRLHEEIEFDKLGKHLKSLKLMDAYRAIGAFCIAKLGLPEEKLKCQLTENDRLWPDRILSNFFEVRDLSRRAYTSRGVSVRHSFATFRIVAKQVKTYFSLAPVELLFRIPEMAAWSVKKRLIS